MKYIITAVCLLLSSSLSYGVHLQLQTGADKQVCSELFKLRLSNQAGNFKDAIGKIADKNGIPQWEEGKLLANPKTKEKTAVFDINNDGFDKSASSFYTWARGYSVWQSEIYG